jgi:hypothetical protein
MFGSLATTLDAIVATSAANLAAATPGSIVSSTGLLLDMIGAILLLNYGIPPKIDPEGHQHIILEQVDEAEIKRAATYRARSSWGLGLLILGFALQLVGNFLG